MIPYFRKKVKDNLSCPIFGKSLSEKLTTMIKILGLADIIAGLILGAKIYHLEIPIPMLLIFASYLVLKGLVFIKDIASVLDILAGILLLVSLIFSLPFFLLGFFALFLIIKGVLSLI